MIFVGYFLDHVSRVYKMWDMVKNRVIISRDIIFLNKLYSQWIQTEVYTGEVDN